MTTSGSTSQYYTFTNVQQGDTSWQAAPATATTVAGAATESPAHAWPAAQPTPDPRAHRAPRNNAPAPESVYVEAHVIDDGRAPWTSAQQPAAGASAPGGGRIAGAAQTVIGLGIAAVGVPMLILPGPGLLAVVGGLVIAGSGAKKVLFGKKK